MKIKFADIIKIILFVALFYGIPGFFFFNSVRSSAIQSELSARGQSLFSVLSLIESLKLAGYEEDICNQLKAEVRSERILLFSYDSKELNCSVPEGIRTSHYPAPVSRGLYSHQKEGLSFSYSKAQFDDATLVVGVERPQEHSLFYYIANSKSLFLNMIIDFGLVLWVVLGFTFLIINFNLEKIKIVLLGRNKQSKLQNFLNEVFKINQFEVLQYLGTETRNKLEKLKDEASLSETHLQYSVIQEIKSQIKNGLPISFPFRFLGVVVRVDINGYSEIMQECTLEESREINSKFKAIAAELALRYEGLFENSAGDEVVYCFRGEKSVMRGISFARDLSQEFAETSFGSQNKRLFVKASLYESEMLMDFGSARVEFDGLALLFTNRMFGGLEIKTQNVIILPAEMARGNASLVPDPQFGMAFSKGMKVDVAYCTDFSLSLKKTNPDLFKSDRYIIEYFDALIEAQEDSPQILSALSKITKTKHVSHLVKKKWIQVIQYLIDNRELRARQPVLLPSLISIGAEIIGPHGWEQQCSEIVVMAARTMDQRVAENAIDALIRVGNSIDASVIVEPKDFKGRLRANALVAAALSSPSDKNLRLIKKMAKDKVQSERHSGLFAAAQVVIGLKNRADEAGIVLTEYKEILRLLNAVDKEELSPRLKTKINEAVRS
jgi:hypothetical protein